MKKEKRKDRKAALNSHCTGKSYQQKVGRRKKSTTARWKDVSIAKAMKKGERKRGSSARGRSLLLSPKHSQSKRQKEAEIYRPWSRSGKTGMAPRAKGLFSERDRRI